MVTGGEQQQLQEVLRQEGVRYDLVVQKYSPAFQEKDARRNRRRIPTSADLEMAMTCQKQGCSLIFHTKEQEQLDSTLTGFDNWAIDATAGLTRTAS